MGCDLYLYLEKYIDGNWVLMKWNDEKTDFIEADRELIKNPEHISHGYYMYTCGLYHERDYGLFAQLGNIKWEPHYFDIDCIKYPVGLPSDINIDLKNHLTRNGLHATYYKVSELYKEDKEDKFVVDDSCTDSYTFNSIIIDSIIKHNTKYNLPLDNYRLIMDFSY